MLMCIVLCLSKNNWYHQLPLLNPIHPHPLFLTSVSQSEHAH